MPFLFTLHDLRCQLCCCQGDLIRIVKTDDIAGKNVFGDVSDEWHEDGARVVGDVGSAHVGTEHRPLLGV